MHLAPARPRTRDRTCMHQPKVEYSKLRVLPPISLATSGRPCRLCLRLNRTDRPLQGRRAVRLLAARAHSPVISPSIQCGIRTRSITASHAEWSASCLTGLGGAVDAKRFREATPNYFEYPESLSRALGSPLVRWTRFELALKPWQGLVLGR